MGLDNSTPSDAMLNLPPVSVIFGTSALMQGLRQKVERVSATEFPVLIQGESGTGKEVICKLIHNLSSRRAAPIIKVSCPAIPGTLIEAELFGYEKGSFTGAVATKPGRVELAEGGTLFLDEISELELPLQAKLLQVLQDGRFARIGSVENRQVDVRLICSTNRRLESLAMAGEFREDLFYRINVMNLLVPPLRDRREDIPIIAEYLLDLYNVRFKARMRAFSPAVTEKLQNHPWPGNIRQLENVIKRYVILGTEDGIWGDLEDQGSLPIAPDLSPSGTIPLKKVMRQVVRDMEKGIILKALQYHSWNRKKAARALGISYQALLYKMQQAQIRPPVPSQSMLPMAEKAAAATSPISYPKQ